MLEKPRLIWLTDPTLTMTSYMKDLGVMETKEFTKTLLRRKLEAEFGSLLQFEDLLGNNRVFVIPENLSRLQLAKEVARLQQQQCECQASTTDDIRRFALELRLEKFGPNLPPTEATPVTTKSKQRSLDAVSECELPIYNAEERCRPPPRSYVEVSLEVFIEPSK